MAQPDRDGGELRLDAGPVPVGSPIGLLRPSFRKDTIGFPIVAHRDSQTPATGTTTLPMALGYSSDQISFGMQLAVATQVLLLLVLATPLMRRLTRTWSPERQTLVAILGIPGSTALYHGICPVFGVGITTGIITIFVTLPLTIANSVLFAIRAFVCQPRDERRAVVFWVPAACIIYWFLVFTAQST